MGVKRESRAAGVAGVALDAAHLISFVAET